MPNNSRAQSAMEYLMTYGWAILIIAVVLAALFELGVFNAGNLGPRAQPGSCRVFRPGGPGTGTNLNLAGVCNGELPQFVGKFSGSSSNIQTTLTFPRSAQAFSLSVWVNPSSNTTCTFYCGIVDSDNGTNGWGLVWWPYSPPVADFWIQGTNQDMEFSGVPVGSWTNIIVTYQEVGGTWYGNGYVNGRPVDLNVARSPITLPEPYSLWIGTARQASSGFAGYIANVQVYNASLSSNEIAALYVEGVGGAPISLQNIVGWWPLNGNAQDYSGNNNNGQISGGVTFTSQWTSGYTIP